jgi:hypothetical protein
MVSSSEEGSDKTAEVRRRLMQGQGLGSRGWKWRQLTEENTT